MNKKNISLVIAFSFLALSGIIGIQYYWISKIYQQNHLLFDQNVNRALKQAIRLLDHEENILFANNTFYHKLLDTKDDENIDIIKNNEHIIQVKTLLKAEQRELRDEIIQEIKVESFLSSDSFSDEMVFIEAKPNQQVEVISEDDTIRIFSKNGITNTTIHIEIDNDSIIHHFEEKSDSLIRILKYRSHDLENEQLELEATVEQLVLEMDAFSRPFSNSIPIDIIQDVLEKTISEYQLPETFEFALLINQDSILFSSDTYSTQNNSFTYFANLFPNELISRNQSINLQFPNNPLYIKLFIPISLSLAFTIILLFGFILIIKNMLHHRNVSEMQSNFINNMTHEFKTPIATISLASDSILTPSIINDQDRISYFTGMIKKENKRMNRLVEKILQMARLENKELELEQTEVNIHNILNFIIENTKMKLGGKGEISAQLKADQFIVIADQDHLTNVVYNLIDNAIKYSDKQVDIKLHSFNTKSMFCLSIEDKGKGIGKKEIPHIFDRFYRIESGNVHNVKGYGLGLSYVKAIIEKHKGQILVNSEEGKGSTFEIRLPINLKT